MPRPERAATTDDLPPYWRAARYPRERAARLAYIGALSYLCGESGLDLTAGRLLLESGYHVVILGHEPPESTRLAIPTLLNSGTRVGLPTFLLRELWQHHQGREPLYPWLIRPITTR